MNRKAKGTTAERELVHLFWNKGWAAIRVAGSGSSSLPSPDLIVGKPGRTYIIECKVCKGDYQYLTKEEIAQLKEFATRADMIPVVGIKFNRLGWYFFFLQNLKETDKLFGMSRKDAPTRGFPPETLFDETI